MCCYTERVWQELTLVEQLRNVLTATVLAGVHGQALGWTTYLPTSSTTRTSCLEIIGKGSEWRSFQRHDYIDLSELNGVTYWKLAQESTECPSAPHGEKLDFRTCGNVRTNSSEVLGMLRRILALPTIRLVEPMHAGNGARRLSSRADDLGLRDAAPLDGRALSEVTHAAEPVGERVRAADELRVCNASKALLARSALPRLLARSARWPDEQQARLEELYNRRPPKSELDWRAANEPKGWARFDAFLPGMATVGHHGTHSACTHPCNRALFSLL
jgi:hypothetical protein